MGHSIKIITDSDGLDPIFSRLDDLMVVGGDMVIFLISVCKVLYFDSHFHAYVISVTTQQCLITISNLLDHNIYHGHKFANNLTYIVLKYLARTR